MEILTSLTSYTFCIIFFTVANAQSYTLPDNVIPSRYVLDLHVNPDSDTYNGFASMTFDVKEPTNSLELHASHRLTITNIIFDQTACEVSSRNASSAIISITCPDNFSLANNIITIAYEGIFYDDARGIFKIHYQENGAQKTAVATQLEATFARRVFPCLDEPRFKAVFDVTIYHPKNYKAIGNGMITENYDASDGQATVFQATPKMPTYLIAFLVSEFEEIAVESTDSFSVYTRPSVKQFTGTALEYGLPLMYKMGNWTNINYFDLGNKKMEQVALQTLPIEAMENWGLITYEEMDQIDEGEDTTIDQKQRIVTTMAHELAHQWFGDLVTMDWWSDTWLNEGFATYFEYHLPALVDNFNFDLERQFASKILQSVLQKDSFPSNPLSNKGVDIQTPTKIQDKFDEISYSKGASIIRMIKGILGENDFQKAIRNYLSENQFQNTNPKQLLKALQSIYEPRPHPIDVTMEPYIYQAGYPLVTVDNSGKTVTITQEKFSILKNDDENATWYVPISYTTSKDKNFDIKITNWLLPVSPLTIQLNDDVDWIIVNLQQSGYYRVNYVDSLWDNLINVLKGQDKDDIDVLNRAQLVDDIFNIARIGKVSYDKVFQLAEYLKNETEYYPWVAYFNGISFILDHITDQETIKLLESLTLKWMNEAFPNENKTAIPATPIEELKNALINEWKCRFKDNDCLDYVTSSYIEFKNTSSFENYNRRHLILCNSLRWSTDPEADFDYIHRFLTNTDSAYARRVILSALGCSQNSDVLNKYAKELSSNTPAFTQQEALTVVKSIFDNGYEGVNTLLQLLKYNMSIDVYEKYEGFFTLSDVISLFGSKINNKDDLNTLQSIFLSFDSLIDDDVMDLADKTITTNIAWASTYNKNIQDVLKKLDGGSGKGHMVYYSVLVIVLTSMLSLFVF